MTNWLEQINAQTSVTNTQTSNDVRLMTNNAIESLSSMYCSGKYMPANMCSFGKDSMVTTSLSMVAWVHACKKVPGLRKVPFIVAYSDTLHESPIKAKYIQGQLLKIAAFAERHHIAFKFIKATPNVNNCWAGKVVSGSINNWNVKINPIHGCAVDWKIDPIRRALKPWRRIANELRMELLELVGSRPEESSVRAQSMDKVGANEFMTLLIDGHLNYYPVYNWTTDDIWSYLQFAEDDLDSPLPAIQDGFTDTIAYYNDMSSKECSAFDKGKSCGQSRDGCYLCLASTREEIDGDLAVTHPHLRPLVDFRKFMLKNDANPKNRSHIPPTLVMPISVKAAGPCGSYVLDMLRYGLTIQMREQERAAKLNEEPTFELFRAIDIAWIDYNWMMRGLQIEAHAALKAYYEIVLCGKRYEIPATFERHTETTELVKDGGNLYILNSDLGSTIEDDLNGDYEFQENTGASWQFAESSDVELLLSNKELVEQWLEEKDFVTAGLRWIKSGHLTPPKSVANRLELRKEWVARIYQNGLNVKAFNGGMYF